MHLDKLAHFAPVVAAVAIAIGVAALVARPAAAAVSDVSGSWTANYSLACSGSLSQTGSDVAGSLECGSGIVLDLSGSFDAGTGAVALSGEFAGVPVTIAATISADGRSMDGSWSAPPLVEGGAFSAVREGEPSTEDVAGFWLISARNIFSSHCSIELEQDGSQLTAALECENGQAGTLDGSYEVATGAISMSGPFGDFGLLEIRVNVSDDGDSYTGIWRLAPDGPAGVMDGERVPAPEPTPTGETPEEAPTATPPTELPATGSGASASGQASWLWGAIAAALALSAACFARLYRVR